MCFDPASALVAIKSAATALTGTAAAAGTAAAGAGVLGTLGTAATVGAGAISAYSSFRNMRAQEAAALQTAKAQDEAARQAIEQGEQESNNLRSRSSALEGQNIAAMAAQGVDVSGSQAIEILDDNQFLAEEDAFAIRTNAQRRGGQLSQQAGNSRAQAATARSNAIWQPVSTVLTTAGMVGNKYAAWAAQNSGDFA